MNKQKYFFNNLLLRYRKCLGKLERLKLNGSNERRQSILEKHLRRLENQLRALFQKINRKVIATAMIAGVALLTSADLQAQISYGAQQLNPFSITQIGTGSFQFNPVDFADLDGDGDLDMISADFFGSGYAGSDFFYYENTGTAESPTFAASQLNPFSLAPGSAYGITPSFVDLDGDGDFDILAQSHHYSGSYGNFFYYENVGTSTAPSFAAETINPFGLGYLALGHPYGNSSVGPGDLDIIDIDNDGDLDIMSGSSSGGFHYFENTGTAGAPSFGAEQLNPFNLAALPFGNPNWSNVTFADLDGDGDFDLLSGAYSGDFVYYENVGSSSTSDFTASMTNPFLLTAIGEGFSKPTFVDLDNDGDMDIMSGSGFGNFYYFENTTPLPTDTTPPVAICQDITIDLDANGDASILATDIDGGSTDNVGIVSYVASMTDFDCSHIGTNNVTLTVTDAAGNSSDCVAVVTIEDNTAPAIVCQDITLELGADGTAMITSTDVLASVNDACGINTTAVDIENFDCSDIGTPVTVTVFAVDNNGNLESCAAIVTVVDLLAPVVTCPTDVTVDPGEGNLFWELGDYFALGEATAIDNCTDPVTITSQDPAPGTLLPDGVYTITMTGEDEYGNLGTCTFELTVDTILGIGDTVIEGFSYAPNPVDNVLNLNSVEIIKEIQIFNILGQKVINMQVDAISLQMDLSKLQTGTYIMKVLVSGKTGTFKVVKM